MVTAGPDQEISRADDRGRYEIRLSGELAGVADFSVIARDPADVVVLPHVEVDPAHRGRGVAGALVRHVFDDVRAQGQQVRPLCPYVVDWLRRHPAELDLVEPEYRALIR